MKQILRFLKEHISETVIESKLSPVKKDVFKSDDCFDDVPDERGIYIFVAKKSLERKAIEGFFDVYGSLPVGNGAFSYR